MRRQRARLFKRFHGEFYLERFPAGHNSRAGDRQPGRGSLAGNDEHRAQPGGRATSAHPPAAEAGPGTTEETKAGASAISLEERLVPSPRLLAEG